ncbi:type 2 DNA topoisomerase 6 subunit B-like isoform X2 [Podarcis raffonei]|uniref:type 2 DNA topoisomerase 6 subunit B-like isoform X2 n=1 Tax=Podarcis raffonei TaxID=65483 RepID=UPI0023299083|nr:type 2 DNA topoisomerase 6 subunit B-like isoform X2 [Podarcis raffonei]
MRMGRLLRVLGTKEEQILEYLFVRLQYAKEDQSEGFSTLERILVVSVDIEDSFQRVHHFHCTTTISAKGDFCYKLLSDQMCREMKDLLPLCQSKALSGRGCPHECIDIMPFQLSFELDEKSGAIEEDCLALKQFIHRISLTHTTVKFHYCVKVNGSISAETYNTERGAATCLSSGIRLLSEGSHFVRSAARDVPSSCDKIHPMTAGLPVLFSTKEASCSFFKDPSCLIAWEKYGYQATLNSDPHGEEGKDTAKPDIRYKLHASHQQDSDAQEQTLLLFLFLSYSDQFNDKTVYNFWDRQVILSHLSPILLCSKQAVKGCIQGVVSRILEQHYKVSREQQKLAQSLPFMADAISSIVSSSTDSEFRRKCLQSLQVADTQKFQVTIKDTFNKVILNQWKHSSACDARRPLPKNDEAGVGLLSADLPLPTIHQKLLGSNFSSAQLEQGEKGFLFVNSDCGGMSQKGSRKIHVEDSGDPHITGVAKSKEKNLLAESGTSSSSFFSYPTKIGCGALQDKSQVVSAGPSVKKIRSHENLWQDDHFWKQEVSNLAKWTS